MKRFTKTFTAAILAILTVLNVPALAAAQTVSIDGYAGEVGASQFTISNVLQKEAGDSFDGLPTYTCGAPAVVTTTADLAELYVTPVVAVTEDGWEEGAHLGVRGDCVVYDDDFVKQTMRCEDVTQEYMIYSYKSGCTVTVDKPGTYHISARYSGLDYVEAVLIVKEAAAPAPVKATPTAAKVLVNGAATSFDAYSIGGSNYFKLRDLAKVVSGTEKQFEVTWDAAKNAINLESGKAYTSTGVEMTKGDGAVKNAISCTSAIYMDGAPVSLTAYTINGSNYFKLRDVAQAFDIGVTWDAVTRTIGINTRLLCCAPLMQIN